MQRLINHFSSIRGQGSRQGDLGKGGARNLSNAEGGQSGPTEMVKAQMCGQCLGTLKVSVERQKTARQAILLNKIIYTIYLNAIQCRRSESSLQG